MVVAMPLIHIAVDMLFLGSNLESAGLICSTEDKLPGLRLHLSRFL